MARFHVLNQLKVLVRDIAHPLQELLALVMVQLGETSSRYTTLAFPQTFIVVDKHGLWLACMRPIQANGQRALAPVMIANGYGVFTNVDGIKADRLLVCFSDGGRSEQARSGNGFAAFVTGLVFVQGPDGFGSLLRGRQELGLSNGSLAFLQARVSINAVFLQKWKVSPRKREGLAMFGSWSDFNFDGCRLGCGKHAAVIYVHENMVQHERLEG